jgi:hypothetical protein
MPCETADLLAQMQADVQTKMACAQSSACLRNLLATACVWKDEVRVDLHDARQLLWLERHCQVFQNLFVSSDQL